MLVSGATTNRVLSVILIEQALKSYRLVLPETWWKTFREPDLYWAEQRVLPRVEKFLYTCKI